MSRSTSSNALNVLNRKRIRTGRLSSGQIASSDPRNLVHLSDYRIAPGVTANRSRRATVDPEQPDSGDRHLQLDRTDFATYSWQSSSNSSRTRGEATSPILRRQREAASERMRKRWAAKKKAESQAQPKSGSIV